MYLCALNHDQPSVKSLKNHKMNKIFKVFFLFVVLFAINGAANAQTIKIAHVNTNEVMNAMPDKAKAEKNLETYYNELQEQLKTMYTEYQNKLQDYQSNAETMSNLVKQSKEKEIVDLESRISAFQANAETEFEQKRAELLAPLLDKIQKAIDAVGKEKGFTYILDVATGTTVFIGDGAVDVTKDVKGKLGIK